ncbi:MAG: DUF2325 domain-containing protein [Desulfovibrio sp.]
MCAALIGGMDRLKRNYINEAKKAGIKLKCFTGKERSFDGKIGNVDFVVLFTNKVSHKARKEIMGQFKNTDTPVYMHHSCGISTLRECLKCAEKNSCPLMNNKN